MGRIIDLLKANINDLIDRAEDPEKMVKQIIRDLQQDVNSATQALGKAMTSQRIAQRQYDNAVKESADWESKAKLALQSGDVDLAKRALSQKVEADKRVEDCQQSLDQITAQVDQLRDQVNQLKGKLEEARSKQASLIARSQIAKTQKDVAQATAGIDASSAMAKFDRMEEKVAQEEAEAAAYAELSGASGSSSEDEKTFEQLQHDAEVDQELQRLMQEMTSEEENEDVMEGGSTV